MSKPMTIKEQVEKLLSLSKIRGICAYCGMPIKWDDKDYMIGAATRKMFHNTAKMPCFQKWRMDKSGRQLTDQEARKVLAALGYNPKPEMRA